MKTNIRMMARFIALSLVLVVSLLVGASIYAHPVSQLTTADLSGIGGLNHSQVLLADGGQESHGGGKGGGGGGHTHG